MRRMISICLSVLMIFSLMGCSKEIQSENLMDGVKPSSNRENKTVTNQEKMTDFAVRLFQESVEEGENTLISPLSVMCALAMTANGAKEETLTQMEIVLGMTVEEMNEYLSAYMSSLPQEEGYKLNLANSIWFKDDEKFTVNEEFLQLNADYYDADIYKAAFDKATLDDINLWVEEKTDKMIPKIVDEIREETIMYLINALAFEAEWADSYIKTQVREGVFTKEDGSKETVDFMYSAVGTYLEDEYAIGFMKNYKDNKYAFVALLPKEGVSVSEYISKLDGEHVTELLSNPQHPEVQTAIPKFETEYSIEMSEVLKGMGMMDAFDKDMADFTGLGTYIGKNILISQVLHKTYISVYERGTKAGAATAVAVDGATAMVIENKEVYLDRPFVYMLIDCENNVPFFIGTMMDVNE